MGGKTLHLTGSPFVPREHEDAYEFSFALRLLRMHAQTVLRAKIVLHSPSNSSSSTGHCVLSTQASVLVMTFAHLLPDIDVESQREYCGHSKDYEWPTSPQRSQREAASDGKE